MIAINIEKKPNETPLEFHKRLVYGKLVDKTLADMDYTELAELVYGQPYSSDVARRMLYGSRRTLELMDSQRADSITDEEILNELDSKMIELKKEQKRFYDQRREFTKLVSEDGRREHLYDRLAEAADNLAQTVGNIFGDDTPDVYSVNEDNEAVLVLSDWHYGMTVDNTFNTYNTDICKERVARVIDSAIERIKLHGCSVLHVVILGDMFHGAIHTSARVASEELVCDQIMQVSEILAQSIERMSRYVPVLVYTTYGNHGRTVQNKQDNLHRDNMERLVPWWLKQRLAKRDNIVVMPEAKTEFIFVHAAGHDICASHGDLDKVQTSPRLLPALFNSKYNKNIECILLGDKHHRESFEELGVTAMICGALCGADDYANDKRLFSTPSQLLLIVNSENGIDAEYRLKCDNQ